MHSIFYDRARDVDHAIELAAAPGARFIGGGTNLLDLYKSGVERPERLVDISRLALAAIEELPDGGVRSQPCADPPALPFAVAGIA
jgi:xanthine dehydrogenase YagS FAD-binding subunit